MITGAIGVLAAIALSYVIFPNYDLRPHKIAEAAAANLNQWDGWIRLQGGQIFSASGGSYAGVKQVQSELRGFAWGSTLAGWISFSSVDCDKNGNGFVDAFCGGSDTASSVAFPYKVVVDANFQNAPPDVWLVGQNVATASIDGSKVSVKRILANGDLAPFARWSASANAVSCALSSASPDTNWTGSSQPITGMKPVTQTRNTYTVSCRTQSALTNTASLDVYVCGDGTQDLVAGEECDKGPSNGTPQSTCSATCRAVVNPAAATGSCGDGICSAANGETIRTCRADCKTPSYQER